MKISVKYAVTGALSGQQTDFSGQAAGYFLYRC